MRRVKCQHRVAPRFWEHEADYSALLFVRAENLAALNANLATLAGVSVLDLPENEAREDEAKIEAVLRWLEANPTPIVHLASNLKRPPATPWGTRTPAPRVIGNHTRGASFRDDA